MSLNIETLIYIYMAICISVLLYNIVYIFVDRSKRNHRSKVDVKLREEVSMQVMNAASDKEVPERHHMFIRKKLTNIYQLEQYHAVMVGLLEGVPKDAYKYLNLCEADFAYLAKEYKEKDEMEQAYFARLMEIYRIGYKTEYTELKRRLVAMAGSPSVYCRENVLRALYEMGNVEGVKEAFLNMSNQHISHYVKMLADGLLKFTGDKKLLAWELWQNRMKLSTEYVLAIMQFIRMDQDGYGEEFLKLLMEPRADKELKLEAIRYYRKYKYEPAYPLLVSYIERKEEMDWEYVAMAVLALGNYPGEETIQTLKSALSSANWYVRYNAAEILVATFKVSYLDISDMYNGEDRYSREILHYMMQKYGQERKGMAYD